MQNTEYYNLEMCVRIALLYLQWEKVGPGKLGQVSGLHVKSESQVSYPVVQTKAKGGKLKQVQHWLNKCSGDVGLQVYLLEVTQEGARFSVAVDWSKWEYPPYARLGELSLSKLMSMHDQIGDNCVKVVVRMLCTGVVEREGGFCRVQ